MQWAWGSRRGFRLGVGAVALSCAAAVFCGGTGLHAAARESATAARAGARRAGAQKKAAELSPWEQAEQGRDALEAKPVEARTLADWTRAMDAYRAIYHANPADVHAAAAVNAVAELLTEQGRERNDAKSLQAAVGQYEFLRKQYPASSLGVQALLAEGQIEQNDLNDAAMAREKYKLLLKQHPKSEQAEEARAGLASLAQGTGKTPQTVAGAKETGSRSTHSESVAANGASAAGLGRTGSRQRTAVSSQHAAVGGSSLPAMAQTAGAGVSVSPLAIEPPAAADNGDTPAAARSGKRALVTGIRHWSTATYTRVAIDLGDSVTYEAARVPNPDRIYFDLHGARLAPELVGKSFAVTDDGFLKKVRAAQYSDDVTRVVLDVNDVTEYSAFLLPNPYRLIIDIHGGTGSRDKAQDPGSAEAAMSAGPTAAVEVPAPRTAVPVKPTAARPVPNSVATKTATSEVADLSELPGRVEATTRPTSKPIAAVVAVGNRKQGSGSRTGGDAGPSGAGVDSAGGTATDADAEVTPNRKTRRSRAKTAGGSSSAATASTAVADATPARAAVPTADGETSLVRALGLKIGRIVIDAGHGGHDSGTLGVDGIEEKDVVLDVALRLGKLLHDRLGAEIIYTRSDDTFIPLETRTAIANKAQADLFLSIHANSSSDASARGVETYYLNFTTDPTALDVAARENAVSDQSIHQLSDLVKKIALKDKIAESREFASDVEGSLYAGLQKGNPGLKDRGVKKAPFVVLIGANMPSILAEISFVTNPKDAEQLREPEYRERVAESLYRGVARYEGGLSGAQVATERAALGR